MREMGCLDHPVDPHRFPHSHDSEQVMRMLPRLDHGSARSKQITYDSSSSRCGAVDGAVKPAGDNLTTFPNLRNGRVRASSFIDQSRCTAFSHVSQAK